MKTDCCFPYNFQFWFTVRAIFQKKYGVKLILKEHSFFHAHAFTKSMTTCNFHIFILKPNTV